MQINVKSKQFNEDEHKNVYYKYLGQNYKFKDNKYRYSIVIANHVSWIEVLNLFSLGFGFLGKHEMENVPLIGFIMKCIESLFISRNDKNSRELALDEIRCRQIEYYNKDRESSILIYPEGTISNGNYLLPFKKGAFYSMYPVKPFLNITDNTSNSFDLSQGSVSAIDHILISSCFFNISYSFMELPTIEFTDYAKQNNKIDKNEEEYITFMNTCHNIMCEIGKLKKTTKGYKESNEYLKNIKNNN